MKRKYVKKPKPEPVAINKEKFDALLKICLTTKVSDL